MSKFVYSLLSFCICCFYESPSISSKYTEPSYEPLIDHSNEQQQKKKKNFYLNHQIYQHTAEKPSSKYYHYWQKEKDFLSFIQIIKRIQIFSFKHIGIFFLFDNSKK